MAAVMLLLAALCAMQLHDANALVKDHSKTLQFSNQLELVSYGATRVIKKMAYALCDKNNNTRERKCKLVREQFPDHEGAYSCEITIRPDTDSAQLETINVTPFGKDKLILTYVQRGERMLVKIVTIEMTSCQSSQSKLYIDESCAMLPASIAVKIVAFRDVYEVVFRNSTLCANKLCKQTLDSNGSPIDSSTISFSMKYWPIFSQQIYPMTDSPADGLLFLHEDHHQFVLDILKPDGSQTTFLRYENHSFPFAISRTHQFVATCYSLQNLSVECAQLDLNANRKLQITLTQNDMQRIENVHNLQSGGFLLLVSRISASASVEQCYFVEKIDASGQNVGTLQKDGFACSLDPQSLVIYENEAKEYCVSWEKFVPDQTDNVNHLQLFAKCFADSDFQN